MGSMGELVGDRTAGAGFEAVVLAHLDAAYSLARWLTRDDHAAEDMVQEAVVRALRFFGGFRGGDGKAWFLTIVRNVCFNWLKLRSTEALHDPFDEDIHSPGTDGPADQPEGAAISFDSNATAEQIGAALEHLPAVYREAFVLKELEGLSYKEIALITKVPMGTVMSRLARARSRLRKRLDLTAEES
jgi:RNA polymerase sigma factor (sigma-70 family)